MRANNMVAGPHSVFPRLPFIVVSWEASLEGIVLVAALHSASARKKAAGTAALPPGQGESLQVAGTGILARTAGSSLHTADRFAGKAGMSAVEAVDMSAG